MAPRGRTRKNRPDKHAFGFLDETGTLGATRDPFFAVGLLRCREPYTLLRPIQSIRDKHHFYDEIKWSSTSAKKLPLLQLLLDVYFSLDASFSALICDKQQHDIIGRFGGQFGAYEFVARQLVWGSIHRGEVLWVIADEYSTPPGHLKSRSRPWTLRSTPASMSQYIPLGPEKGNIVAASTRHTPHT